MTDTIEAVARAHKLLGKLPRSDFDDVLALLESERARAIAAYTKALIEGAGDLVSALKAWAPLVSSGYEVPAAGQKMLQAAATIAVQKAEIKRLTRALHHYASDPLFGNEARKVLDTLADSDGDDGA